MAHYYGLVKGQRGEASRLGSKSSGLTVIAASWNGAIKVTLTHINGNDYANIERASLGWVKARIKSLSQICY